MRKILYLPILCACAFLWVFGATESTARDQAALTKRLSYLQNIPEISWVEYDRNNVYVGFNKRPDDLKTIINAAAAMGNRAYGFGVHVWAVKANKRGWQPGDGTYYCEATARHGQVEKSSCK